MQDFAQSNVVRAYYARQQEDHGEHESGAARHAQRFCRSVRQRG